MLRKEEMMSRMMAALQEMQGFNEQVSKYLRNKDETIRSAQRQWVFTRLNITSDKIKTCTSLG